MLLKCLLLIVVQLHLLHGLDLNWIPNDPNAASLPLSSSYRKTLRQLCDLLHKKSTKLPPEMEQKRKTIEKMCQKLAIDDQVSPPADSSGSSDRNGIIRWAFPLCALAGVCYWGYNRHMATPRAAVTAGVGDINRAREARLKRYKDS